MSRTLSSFRLPLNFDRRADVTLLIRRTDRVELPFLIWLEWANERRDWRPLSLAGKWAMKDEAPVPDWLREDLTYVIESFCRWSGDPGALMRAAVESGMFRLTERGGRWGIELADFWDYNADLDPHYQAPSAKGGAAKAVKAGRARAIREAGNAMKLAELQQPDLIMPTGQTQEQRKAGIALIIQVDRAISAPKRLGFPEDLISDAVLAVESTPPEQVEAVLVWLVGQRENPEVVKRTDRILRDWREVKARVSS